MKKYGDEQYKKYEWIIYQWTEKVDSKHGLRVFGVRRELYAEQNDFYVFGIGVSDFLEPKSYDPEEDIATKLDPSDRSTIKYMTCSDRITLDDITELNRQLKEAGAKKVYLHQSTWMDGKREKAVLGEIIIAIE